MNTGMIEDLERQIDHTRHALDGTIRALQVELSPRHQMEEAWRAAKERTERSLRTGAGWAAANPVPLAFGAVVVVVAALCAATGRQRRPGGFGLR